MAVVLLCCNVHGGQDGHRRQCQSSATPTDRCALLCLLTPLPTLAVYISNAEVTGYWVKNLTQGAATKARA